MPTSDVDEKTMSSLPIRRQEICRDRRLWPEQRHPGRSRWPSAIRRSVVTCATVLLASVSVAQAQVWEEEGPGPITQGQVENITDGEVVGAVHAVAVHPTDPDVVYVGAANGGIWKTADATATSPSWVPQLGLDQALSIGAIAFDPTDATNETLVAGAGRFSSYGRRGADRVGVWRTTDAGATWNLLGGGGDVAGLNVSGVAPRGGTIVVSANTADNPADRGIWRSTDGGGSWTQISGAAATGLPAGASYDLASDPSDDSRLFTNAGTNGLYRSTDTGATWTKVSDAAVDALLGGTTSNVEIAVGSSDNVYAAIVNGGQLAGLFRSPDGDAPWTALDLPTTTEGGVAVGIHPGRQGATHLSIVADPGNADVVYVGGDRQAGPLPNSIGANDWTGRLFRVDASQPTGSQASHITHSNTGSNSAPHADSRDMAFDAAGDLIEVDDGGVYKRTDPSSDTGDWSSLNGDVKVTELHDIAWDANAEIAIGGAQDTGTPEQALTGDVRWRSVATADGGDVAVDDTGTPGVSVRYSSFQGLGAFRRRTYDATNTLTSQVFPSLTVVDGGDDLVAQFTTPIAVNDVDPTRLIIGGANSVYESLDQGETISEIGPGIRVNAGGRDPIAYGAAGNADMLYVGSGDQVFVRTTAAPATLDASAAYPGAGTGRWVADIAIHPGDPQTAYVVDRTNVYRTPDAGMSWTDVTGDLAMQTPGTLRSVAFSTSNADGSVIVGGDNGVFMASGPAFTTWLPAGTGLPRAPVYDLDYDATDDLLVAGVLGRGAWSASLASVDVALVLDLSGSMLSPACSTCDPKLQVLKDAVEMFLQLWRIVSVPGDRVGVNYFRTDVSEFLVDGDALFPLLPNTTDLIADVQGQSTTPANLTAMGGGLQTAVNRLTDASRPRSIVLFTDGMQNVNPMVDETTLEIDDEPGRPDSGVDPTSPPTQLNGSLDIAVNTIGVGATPPFVDLLNDIASETGGLPKLTTAPDDDLRRFFVEELVQILRDLSPQLLDYRYGEVREDTADETFTVNRSARKVIFKVSWERGRELGVQVRKDGRDLTRIGRIVDGPFYRIFHLDLRAVSDSVDVRAGGDWTVRIRGEPGSRYEVAAIVDEPRLEYDFSVAGADHRAGDPLELGVRLAAAGDPVTGARVSATVLKPDQGLGTLLSLTPAPADSASSAHEAGATDAQRKFQQLLGREAFVSALRSARRRVSLSDNGDGTYSARFSDTEVAGAYTVRFRVEGRAPDVGEYRRTEEVSTHFRIAEPDPDASDLWRTHPERDPDGETVLLHLRPVDRFGNYLGPDYGHAISVLVDGQVVAAEPDDRLDGSYTLPLRIASGSDPVVRVLVLNEPLFEGRVSRIPRRGAGGFRLSAHAGVSVPVTGFPSAAQTGFLWEVDLEYRATPVVSLEGVFGRYDLGSPGTVTGGTLYLKAHVPAGTWRFYGGAGPGIFKPPGGSAEFGASAAAGINRPLGGGVELDTGVSYTHIFDARGLGFLGLRAGLKAGL